VTELTTRRVDRTAVLRAAVVLFVTAVLAAITAAANWRIALLATVAASAVALTRMRYSPALALTVLTIVLALAAVARIAR